MSKSITISLSDTTYEALRRESEQARQSPEEVAASMITRNLGTPSTSPAEVTFRESKDRLLAIMRERGLFVDPHDMPPHPLTALLPPRGSPEEAKLIDEVGEELNNALDRSGTSISDLIER